MEIVRCFWIVLADAGNRIKNAWFDQWAWEHKQGMKLHIFTVTPKKSGNIHSYSNSDKSLFYICWRYCATTPTHVSKSTRCGWNMAHGSEIISKGKSKRNGDVTRHPCFTPLSCRAGMESVLKPSRSISDMLEYSNQLCYLLKLNRCLVYKQRISLCFVPHGPLVSHTWWAGEFLIHLSWFRMGMCGWQMKTLCIVFT